MNKIFHISMAVCFLFLGYELQAKQSQDPKILQTRNKNPILKKRRGKIPFLRPSQNVISSVDTRESITLLNGEEEFFPAFLRVLYFIHAYEQGYIKGLHVCFDHTGIYYNQKYGENWWEYYFAPIVLGEIDSPFAFRKSNCPLDEFPIQVADSQVKNNLVVQKYIHIKRNIQDEVDSFIAKNWQDHFVVGIEYYKEANRSIVSYQKMLRELENQIQPIEKEKKDYRIFLVTNEPKFLNALKNKFFERLTVVDCSNVEKDPYLHGKEALLHCLLLARCNLFVATDSTLRTCVSCLNPSISHRIVHPD